MQPPGPGRNDCLAASQGVGSRFAVPVDEGLIPLKGLDPRPGILARHARRKPTARLACTRMRVPMLPEHTPAAEDLDAFLPALGAATGDHVAATRDDGTRKGHAKIVGNAAPRLPASREPHA